MEDGKEQVRIIEGDLSEVLTGGILTVCKLVVHADGRVAVRWWGDLFTDPRYMASNESMRSVLVGVLRETADRLESRELDRTILEGAKAAT